MTQFPVYKPVPPKPLGDITGFNPITTGKQHRKLVAAVMTQGVIDLLEVVHVTQNQRKFRIISLEEFFDDLLEGATVVQSCQIITGGRLAQLLHIVAKKT